MLIYHKSIYNPTPIGICCSKEAEKENKKWQPKKAHLGF